MEISVMCAQGCQLLETSMLWRGKGRARHNINKQTNPPGFEESSRSSKESKVKWLQQRRANNRLKLIFKIAALPPKPAASSALALWKLNPRKHRSLAFSSPPTSSSPTFFHPSDRNSSFAHSHGQIHSVKTPPSPPLSKLDGR